MVKEAKIQELNLDPSKKYLISFKFDKVYSMPKDVIYKVMGSVKHVICDTCGLSELNVITLPFDITVTDITVNDIKSIKESIDEFFLKEK